MNPRTLWRQATSEQRRWIMLNAVLIAAIINAVLSALIAWGSAANEDNIPLWAAPLAEGPSTVTDTVGTFFVLPFLTTLIITSVIWSELRKGRVLPLSRPIARIPRTRLRRAAYFGLICMAVLSAPAVLVLVLLDFGDLSVGQFVLYKAIFGIVFGAAVTPPIALFAMSDGVPPAKVKEAPSQLAQP